MHRTLLAAALSLAPFTAQAADAIVHLDTPGQTLLYVRVRTAATTSVAAALTEGTGNGVGYYVVTDATLVTAGLSGTAVYPYKIFSGTPSTSANDPLLGVGSLRWVSTAVVDPLPFTVIPNFPTNFAALGINASGHVSRVTLAETITTYTGNTVQTGDSFARIGVNGAGLTEVSGGSTTIPVNQVPVPEGRTWIVTRGPSGLIATVPIGMKVGEIDVPFAIDFRNELATNGRLSDFNSVAIQSGAVGGVTFHADLDVDKVQAKGKITPITAGTYYLKATATKSAHDGGGEAIAIVRLIVTD